MTTVTPVVGVLGAGSYGTALAIALAGNGHPVWLWSHDPAEVTTLAAERCNAAFLPGIPFPPSLTVTADLQATVANCRDLLVVVPSHAFGEVLTRVKPFLRPDSRIAWATKGLEADTGRLLHEVAREVVGPSVPLAVLSGPTFATELARALPTAIAVAGDDDSFDHDLAALLHNDRYLRVYHSPDLIGLQLGGAVKNVIAIGAGLADGLGFGANARTALITRGLAEMTRLGLSLGAQPQTFMGMAGLGDLVLTCTDNQSRNRRFGIALGQGKAVADALASIGQVVEGLRNTREVYLLAQRQGVEMPITEQLYAVLYGTTPPLAAAKALLGRSMKSE